MKKQWMGLGLGILALLAGGLVFEGCKQSVDLLNPGKVLAPALGTTVVSNFNYASLKVNPTLAGSKQGVFLDGTYASQTDSGLVLAPPYANSGCPYTGGSAYALHLFGTYIDYGNGGYPAFEIECFPVANAGYNSGAGPMFDASAFTGVSFWWNQGLDDNANQIFFCLITARIAPQSIGGSGVCGGPGAVPCYDYLGNNLLGYPKGCWFQIQEDFSSMSTQYSSGSPTTVTPTDLTQILQLMWATRSNNAAGNYTADIWLEDVAFY